MIQSSTTVPLPAVQASLKSVTESPGWTPVHVSTLVPAPPKPTAVAPMLLEVTVTVQPPGVPDHVVTRSTTVNIPESKSKSSSLSAVAFAPTVKVSRSSPLVLIAAPLPSVKSVANRVFIEDT